MKSQSLVAAFMFTSLAVASCALHAQSTDKIETISPGAPSSPQEEIRPEFSLENYRAGASVPVRFALPLRENADLWTEPRQSRFSERGWEDLVEFSETPFRQQVRMPLGTLFGGRISLGGFQSTTPMYNVERGLPGGGSLDPWCPIPMGRGGMILPKDESRYGLSLTIFESPHPEPAKGIKLDEVFSWIAARSLP